MSVNNYFCKNRKSKLHFGDHVVVINVFLTFTKLEGVGFFAVIVLVCFFKTWF
jgi:hypothetical protein